jgi:hypothetical protein
MKMVKSLLLGSAAGVVAAAGAQAADLPVKAKPVEYVKVCSLYGAGFYYIPGTDICTKFGGYIRYQVSWGAGDSPTFGPHAGTGGLHERVSNGDVIQRSRAILTWDTRQQTSYGTLRTYLITGVTQDTSGGGTAFSLYANRALIQLAGFTFGKATSYFDFFASAAVAYNAGFLHTSDTGDAGHIVAAYTHQFGNGVSATISAEQARRRNTVNAVSPGVANPFTTPGTGNPPGKNFGGANILMDVVGNIRVQQAWGGAMVAAAAHDASVSYYNTANETSGYPSNKWGFAVTGALRLNAPMIAQGDYFQAQVVYTEGAIQYASNTPSTRSALGWNGASVGWGYYTDAVFGPSPSSIELTTAWAAAASYEHFWTPSLRTSVYGNYLEVNHNDNAKNLICGSQRQYGCDPDWSAWAVGSRSQWDIVRGLYLGFDVTYLFLNTSNKGRVAVVASGTGAKPAGTYLIDDQDVWAVTWRIHRDVVP